MNCINFNTTLERMVENREPSAPMMLEHVKTCAECRLIWKRHQQLEVVIHAWKFAEPRSGLVDFVVTELARPESIEDGDDSESQVSDRDLVQIGWIKPPLPIQPAGDSLIPRKVRSSSLAIGSIAASLLIAVIFIAQFSGQDPKDQSFANQSRHQERKFVDNSLDLSGTLTAVLSDLRSEYGEIASETSSAALGLVNAIPHPVAVSLLPDADEIQLLPNSSDMARIWRPIGSRVEIALGFLWPTAPSDVPSG